ncbi:hypothetical protein QTP70_008268 [Hemibagrus guttatus]|uniref:Uncharacterized protein n=1 Tax=Hemibagrus guttatus TaxID=175788 RepID=A0AAE0VC85_9TELE|nr:hypothetical protein QTP70_008268 [Hemibagrus guttatus]
MQDEKAGLGCEMGGALHIPLLLTGNGNLLCSPDFMETSDFQMFLPNFFFFIHVYHPIFVHTCSIELKTKWNFLKVFLLERHKGKGGREKRIKEKLVWSILTRNSTLTSCDLPSLSCDHFPSMMGHTLVAVLLFALSSMTSAGRTEAQMNSGWKFIDTTRGEERGRIAVRVHGGNCR